MKHLLISCLAGVAVAFCLATTVAAQEPPLGHSLAGEAWALQFGIANNLSLRDFQGAVISAKHHRSSERAVRYGLSVFAEHMNGDTGSSDRTRASVGFVAHFLDYPTLARDPHGTVQLFWGLGPRLEFDLDRFTQPDDNTVTQRSLSVGTGGTIGAEWFVRPRISLSAEYETTLMVRFASDLHASGWAIGLGPRGVLFGVSAYFR